MPKEKEGDGRRAIFVQVSSEAHDAWRGFADAKGVSMSALIESLAEQLDQLDSSSAEQLTQRARVVDAQRRRRKTN